MNEPRHDNSDGRDTAEEADEFVRGKEDIRPTFASLDIPLPNNEETKTFLKEQEDGMHLVMMYASSQLGLVAEEEGHSFDGITKKYIHNGIEILNEEGLGGYLMYNAHIDFQNIFRDIKTLKVAVDFAADAQDVPLLQDEKEIDPESVVTEISFSSLRDHYSKPISTFPSSTYYLTKNGILKYVAKSDNLQDPQYERKNLSVADILLVRNAIGHFGRESGMLDVILPPVPDAFQKAFAGVNLDPSKPAN